MCEEVNYNPFDNEDGIDVLQFQAPCRSIYIEAAFFGWPQWALVYYKRKLPVEAGGRRNLSSSTLSTSFACFRPFPFLVMASLNSIAADIIYHIMLRIRGRDDLLSFILSCRRVYETFKEHPNSTLRRVVCNEFHMRTDAFPLAWEVAILQQMVESGHAEESDQHTVGAISGDTAFTASEYSRLGRNHAVIASLAKRFSIQ
jgi:hypothetical protein